jgi:hypothetical protein
MILGFKDIKIASSNYFVAIACPRCHDKFDKKLLQGPFLKITIYLDIQAHIKNLVKLGCLSHSNCRQWSALSWARKMLARLLTLIA